MKKHEKRWWKCVGTHEACYPLLLYASLNILDDPPPFP